MSALVSGNLDDPGERGSAFGRLLAAHGLATGRRLVEQRTHEATVHYFDFASRRASVVFTQAGPVQPGGMTVSPAEAWIVRHQHSLPQVELMLVENFR